MSLEDEQTTDWISNVVSPDKAFRLADNHLRYAREASSWDTVFGKQEADKLRQTAGQLSERAVELSENRETFACLDLAITLREMGAAIPESLRSHLPNNWEEYLNLH